MIEIESLISPIGPLEAFPNEASNVFRVRVQAYIDAARKDSRVQALDEAKRDAVATPLALYLGTMADYRRMLREPLTVTIAEKGSHGYSTKQIDGMLALAEQYRAEFEALLPVATSVVAEVHAVSVPSFVNWGC